MIERAGAVHDAISGYAISVGGPESNLWGGLDVLPVGFTHRTP
jgi:hypothetical protein